MTNPCGVAKTLKVIGSKWSILILHNIIEGKNRFGQLQRALESISPKNLSLRLAELEKEGLITKKIFAEVPLHVEYAITKKGQTLGEIFNKMDEWGKKE